MCVGEVLACEEAHRSMGSRPAKIYIPDEMRRSSADASRESQINRGQCAYLQLRSRDT